MKWLYLLILAVLVVNNGQYIPTNCDRVSPCVCKDRDTGMLVDLRPLANSNGTARFLDVPTVGAPKHLPSSAQWTKFSFNPCFQFSEKSSHTTSNCENVAVCAFRDTKPQAHLTDIGEQDSATFDHFDNGNLSLNFVSKDGKYKTIISLYCKEDSEDYLRVPGYFEHGSFNMIHHDLCVLPSDIQCNTCYHTISYQDNIQTRQCKS